MFTVDKPASINQDTLRNEDNKTVYYSVGDIHVIGGNANPSKL
jgi:hypothetical protein